MSLSHTLAPEDLIEAGRELGVPIAEQEAGLDLAVLKQPSQLPGLWTTQAPVGEAVQPARWTQRLPISKKKRT